MTGDETDALVTLIRHGVTALSNAADRLASGSQSARWFEEQAATCHALATAFTTRAEHLRRADESGKDSSHEHD